MRRAPGIPPTSSIRREWSDGCPTCSGRSARHTSWTCCDWPPRRARSALGLQGLVRALGGVLGGVDRMTAKRSSAAVAAPPVPAEGGPLARAGPGAARALHQLPRRQHGRCVQRRVSGQRSHSRGEQTVAITARTLRGLVTPGTVVAAECCYGAQLFDSAPGRRSAPVRWPRGARASRSSTCAGRLRLLRQHHRRLRPGGRQRSRGRDLPRLPGEGPRGRSLGRAALEARIAYARSVKWGAR